MKVNYKPISERRALVCLVNRQHLRSRAARQIPYFPLISKYNIVKYAPVLN